MRFNLGDGDRVPARGYRKKLDHRVIPRSLSRSSSPEVKPAKYDSITLPTGRRICEVNSPLTSKMPKLWDMAKKMAIEMAAIILHCFF